MEPHPSHPSMPHPTNHSRMPLDNRRLIRLLEILLLLIRQRLAPGLERLVDPLDAAEADDGRRAALVDPGLRDRAHGPAFLLRELFDAVDDRDVGFGELVDLLRLFGALRAGGRAEGGRRAGEVAGVEGAPLCGLRLVTGASCLMLMLMLMLMHVLSSWLFCLLSTSA